MVNSIGWPARTLGASLSRTKAVIQTVERSPITNTGSTAPVLV